MIWQIPSKLSFVVSIEFVQKVQKPKGRIRGPGKKKFETTN